jgi:hypothetical protein
LGARKHGHSERLKRCPRPEPGPLRRGTPHAFVFEEIETGISALRAQVGKGQVSNEKRPPRPRKGFPPHLERIELVIEPEELPEHAGKRPVLIG